MVCVCPFTYKAIDDGFYWNGLFSYGKQKLYTYT